GLPFLPCPVGPARLASFPYTTLFRSFRVVVRVVAVPAALVHTEPGGQNAGAAGAGRGLRGVRAGDGDDGQQVVDRVVVHGSVPSAGRGYPMARGSAKSTHRE